jgi:glycosyltransferase involved in cell wall biosynthesis
MHKLKVLHVITTLPRLSGAADNTRYTVNLLDRERYDVHLACGPAALDASQVAAHVRLKVVPSLVRPAAPVSDLRALWALYRLCARERYDIVHTHNAKAGVLGRVAARLADIPVAIHTAHSISFVASKSAFTNWVYRILDKISAHLCAKIITVSEINTKTYLDARIGRPEQYLTIYSGIDLERYGDRSARAECRRELGIAAHEVLVVWIGRLNRQKDPITFLRAAKEVVRRVPRARFVMIGEDSLGVTLEPQVRQIRRDLGLESVVQLVGYRPDVHRFLAAADLVMHTSLYEGMGRSITESMISGVPLVATSVDGVREAVVGGERGGLLAPPRNPGALADAAVRLIEDAALSARLTAAGQAWARTRFDVQGMVRSIDELYQNLWKDHHTG